MRIAVLSLPTLARRHQALVSGVLFQLGWFLCVLGGSMVALPVTLCIVGLHLLCHERRRHEFRFIVVVTLIGLLSDWLLLRLSVLQPQPEALLQPLWLLCLWPLFATTFATTLRWFRQRSLLTNAILGGLAAPLSYLGGSHLAGVALMQPTGLALAVIGVIWAMVFPLLILVYERRLS